MTEDLLAVPEGDATAVLPEDALPEELPPADCALLEVLLEVLLFLLMELLVPIPPLSDVLEPNTRSDPV